MCICMYEQDLICVTFGDSCGEVNRLAISYLLGIQAVEAPHVFLRHMYIRYIYIYKEYEEGG